MHRAPVARRVVIVLAAVLFAASMLGIVLTGPMIVRVGPRELAARASPERLRRDVAIVGPALAGEAAPGAPGLERLAGWIGARLTETGLEVATFEHGAGSSARDLIAAPPQRGRGPAVVVAARFAAGPGPAPGSASGTAALLELARTLAEMQPPRDFVLVALGASAGSEPVARHLLERGWRPDLAVVLGNVGFEPARGADGWLALRQRLLYPATLRFTAVLGDLRSGRAIGRVKRGLLAGGGAPVVSLRAPVWLAPVDSPDQAGFRRAGLPAVRLASESSLAWPDVARREDPNRLDYPRMAALVRALHGVLHEASTTRP